MKPYDIANNSFLVFFWSRGMPNFGSCALQNGSSSVQIFLECNALIVHINDILTGGGGIRRRWLCGNKSILATVHVVCHPIFGRAG